MQRRDTRHKLAAILSADAAGFSRLMERDEAGTHRRLVAARRVVDGSVERHGGRIVGSAGDSVLAEFPSAVEAVTAAVEAQEVLTRENTGLTPEQRLEFRIGINLGEVIVDGADIFGDGVNIAARLQALAKPGGVWISGRVYDQVGTKLPYLFRSRGTQRVKNLTKPVRVYSVEWRGGASTVVVSIRRWLLPATAAAMLAAGVLAASVWVDSGLLSMDTSAWLGGRTPPLEAVASKPAVAVLPFANQSGDPGQDYFSDGMSEDVTAALARFPGLAVLSSSAVAPFRDKPAAPAEIGRALGARYLVRGGVRRAGDRIRLTAELIDAGPGVVLWSERYDAEVGDVFALQDEIVRDVAGTLAVNLDRVEQERALRKPTGSLQAYDYVLRGRELTKRLSRAANLEARAMFEKAIELDPAFAAAHAELSRTYWRAFSYGWTEFPLDALHTAEELAQKAVSLDPRGTDAHRTLGEIHLFHGRHDLAIEELDQAIALNPSDAQSYAVHGFVLTWSGETDEAIGYFQTALRLMPELSRGETAALGLCYYLKELYGDAIRVLTPLVGREPDFDLGHIVLAATYAQLGDHEAAAREAERIRKLRPFFELDEIGTLFRDPEHRARLVDGLRKAGLAK